MRDRAEHQKQLDQALDNVWNAKDNASRQVWANVAAAHASALRSLPPEPVLPVIHVQAGQVELDDFAKRLNVSLARQAGVMQQ